MLRFLLDATFGRGASFELIETGKLSQPAIQSLAGLTSHEDVYGIFTPKNPAGNDADKIAYKDVALLHYHLQEPQPLPAFIRNVFCDDTNAMLAKLVLEGVLTIQSGNGFYSGIDATPFLFCNPEKLSGNHDKHITQLSRKAIEHVLDLHTKNVHAISSRLYAYNTVPVLYGKYPHLDEGKKVETFIYSDATLRYLSEGWSRLQSDQFNWLIWQKKSEPSIDMHRYPTYKLYISTVPGEMPKLFARSIKILSSTKAFCFKTGADLPGILRPDKFIVYFHHYDDMQQAAVLLEREIKDHTVQGVPFTEQLDEKGLLSWGIDPPRIENIVSQEGVSWRSMTIEKIASAVVQTKGTSLSREDSYRFIMQKIESDGVNPDTWGPLKK